LAKVKSSPTLQSCKDVEELRRFVGAFNEDAVSQINGRLTFGDNIKSTAAISISFTGAGSIEVPHSFGQVPEGFLVIYKTAGVDIYASSTTWTDTKIFLTAGGAVNAKIIVI
jgi:hypothetical protein